MKKHEFKEGDGMTLENSTSEERRKMNVLLEKKGCPNFDSVQNRMTDNQYRSSLAYNNGEFICDGKVTNPLTYQEMKALICPKKSFKISKKEILAVYENKELLKDMFPKCFEVKKPVLEAGKWHRGLEEMKLFVIESKDHNNIKGYGFGINGKWINDDGTYQWGLPAENHQELTPQEVQTALEAEAKRRGFVDGATFRYFEGDLWTVSGNIEFEYKNGCLKLWSDVCESVGNNSAERGFIIILKSGKWCEITQKPEITISEAEAKLNNEFKIKA